MTTAQMLQNFGDVAFAAYGTLSTGATNLAGNLDALREAGFSLKQATEFAKRYASIVLPAYHDTVSDLDVTVFKDAAGNLTLGIRGTLPGHDLLVTDALIAAHGAGYDQIVALYNWWQRVSQPAGASVPQFAMATYVGTPPQNAVPLFGLAYLVPAAPASATGEMVGALAADPDRKIDVTGHSLGGHLALAFNTLFAPVVGQAVGFDTPGFTNSTANQRFFAALGGSVPTAANSANFISVVADESGVGDKPFGAVAALYSRPGVAVDISIENQWLSDEPTPETSAFNHSMKMLADSLAVYNLLSALDPSLTTTRYKTLLNGAASGTAASYERLVDAVEGLLNVNSTYLPTGNTQRDALYQAIYALQGNAAFSAVANNVRVDPSSTDLRAKARNDFSALASLVSLSPLVLTATNSANQVVLDGVMQSAWGNTFTDWQSDLIMSQADREAGKEVFSDRYLADRSAMLDTSMQVNLKNVLLNPAGYLSVQGPSVANSNTRYVDLASGATLQVYANRPTPTTLPNAYMIFGDAGANTVNGESEADHLYAGAGDDTLNGLGGSDYLEGNAGIDRLYGGDGADTLLGGAGDDFLYGEADRDVLRGGDGADTLDGGTENDQLFGNDGVDSLIGGAGNDQLDGGAGADTLDGGADNDQLIGAEGLDTYRFSANWGADVIQDSDGQGLIQVIGLGPITGAGAEKIGTTTWQTTDKRVTYNLVQVTETTQNLVIAVTGGSDTGSITVRGWNLGQLGIVLDGQLKQPVTGTTFVGDFHKRISPDGTTYLIGTDGNYLGDGAQPGAADLFNGTAGADLIRGLAGNDALLGHAGDDLIEGGDGVDVLMGGLGADTIDGGAGNDAIYGSSDGSLLRPTSTSYTPPDATRPYVFGQGFSWVVDASGHDRDGIWDAYLTDTIGRDTQPDDEGNSIDAGAGDDLVLAGTGADVVHGGDDSDDIYGMAGSDALYGDDGADRIYGDGSAVTLALYATAAELHGNDVIVGGAGNDILLGQGGDDELYGGADNDKMWGDDRSATDTPISIHGSDYLDGGDGDDYIEGGGKDDTLYGGNGADTLFGDGNWVSVPKADQGNDYLDGEAGDDELTGGSGDDDLFGGADNDKLWGDGLGSDPVAQGKDYLDGEDGDDQLVGGGNDDELFGGAGNDRLFGDDAEATVAGALHGRDYLDGGAGDDELTGGGNDDELYGGAGDDFLRGDDDIANLAAGSHGNDYLSGGAGDDILLGDGGNDTLDGDGGNDTLAGGDGDDMLDGGAGRNGLFGDKGNDVLVSSGADYLDGGEGDDTFIVPLAAGGPVSFIADTQGVNTLIVNGGSAAASAYRIFVQGDMVVVAFGDGGLLRIGAGVDLNQLRVQLSLDGSGGIDTVSLQDIVQSADAGGRIASGMQVGGQMVDTALATVALAVQGGARGDAITGGSGNDTLDGADGGDKVSGGLGNDTLFGGNGADIIVGGEGDDTLFGGDAQGRDDGAGDTFVFALGDGVDRIGAAAVAATGAARNAIRFGPGINAGNVQFSMNDAGSGAGNGDVVIDYSSIDRVTLASGAFGQVERIDFDDGSSLSHAQVLTLLNARASSGAGVINGTAEGDRLVGGAAGEQLYGLAGDDVLQGSGGNDLLVGGSGLNTYVFEAASGSDVIDPTLVAAAGGAEQGLIRFTAAQLAEVSAAIDGFDLMITQPSGALVRLRGYQASAALAGWRIEDRDGASLTLEALLARPGNAAPSDLVTRRDAFLSNQLGQLATLSQRYNPNARSIGAIGAAAMVLPDAVTTVSQQLAPDEAIQHGSFLTLADAVTTKFTITQVPQYQSVTTTIPGDLGHFVPLPVGGGLLPAGATLVYGPVSFYEPPGVIGGTPGRDILGYMTAPHEASTITRQQVVGWDSVITAQTALTPHNSATQALVTGTAGDDVITAAQPASNYPTLFRGAIDTGAGNDVVTLVSGSNTGYSATSSRFDDWDTEVPSLYGSAYPFQPFSGNVKNYGRGLGAWIDLGAGDDQVSGSDGNDFIIGGAGSDWMDGQAGADTYFIGRSGGGVDHISDLAYSVKPFGFAAGAARFAVADSAAEEVGIASESESDPQLELAAGLSRMIVPTIRIILQPPVPVGPANEDTIEFDAGIGLGSLSYRWNDAPTGTPDPGFGAYPLRALELYQNGQHFLDIDYLPGLDSQSYSKAGIEKFRFADGQALSLDQLLAAVPERALTMPVLTAPFADVAALEDEPLQLALASHFRAGGGAPITFSATLADGSALPAFMTLDPATGVLSAAPDNDDVGNYVLRLQASTDAGSVDASLQLRIDNVNDAPVVVGAVAAAIEPVPTSAGVAFSWTAPTGLFSDVDAGDSLALSARRPDGSALPAWLAFDAATRTLSGTRPTGDASSWAVAIVGTDSAGATAATTFEIRYRDSAGRVHIDGTAGNDMLRGSAADDFIEGLGGNDVLLGGAGNDTLSGGLGLDVLDGGAGDDTYVIEGQDVPVVGGAAETLRDDQGANTLVFRGGGPTAVTSQGTDAALTLRYDADHALVLENGLLGEFAWVDEGAGPVSFGTWLQSRLGTGVTVQATAAEQTLYGGSAADSLSSMLPGSRFDGGAGDDVLSGSGGHDTYRIGLGGGIDRIVDTSAKLGADGLAAPNRVLFGAGITASDLTLTQDGSLVVKIGAAGDAVRIDGFNPVNTAAFTAIDSFEFDDGSTLSYAQLLARGFDYAGTAGADTIIGTDAPDRFAISAGNDVLKGGEGSDTYAWGLDSGQDLVDDRGIGTASIDTLVVAAGLTPADLVLSRRGNDLFVQSRISADTLTVAGAFSGLGVEQMVFDGGLTWTAADIAAHLTVELTDGNDDFSGSDAADRIDAKGGSDIVRGLGGDDTIDGGAGDDALYGGAGNDTLDGGLGNDTLVGGAGNDVYVVNASADVVIENAGEGTDMIQSSVTLTLAANVENLTLTGSAVINGTGNGLDNVLIGNAANNTLTGGAGNDTLDGGLGSDTMVGGAGDDTYVVNATTDVVTESAGQGADTVRSAVSWTLGANVEKLSLTGNSVINGTGNALDNVLVGNSANNTLAGGAGNDFLDGGLGSDTMLGGTGNDVYVVDAGTDVVTEKANEGIDSVISAVTWTLGANVENLALTGDNAVNGTGNALANVLVGNAAANVLAGGEGNDIYYGGAGNDTFTDTSLTSNDTYLWGLGSGNDTLADSGGSLDHVDLFAGITKSQLTFAKNVNNLELGISGAADKLVISNWYTSSANQIEEFRLGDGSRVLASEVQGLVSAMAAFGAPASAALDTGRMTVQPVWSQYRDLAVATM